jgi:hypothetical protein
MPNPTHSNEAKAFAQRLKAALQRAGIRPSPTIVANEFNLRYWGRGITTHTARNWLLGVSIPMQDKLRVLAEWLEIDPEALRFGPSAPARMLGEAGPIESRLRHGDVEMIERYLAMPPDAQKTVREVVLGLSLALAAGKPRPPRR